MRRPPWFKAFAIRSTPRAICGKAGFTAAETLVSWALMMLAISREDFRSRFPAAALGCSVGRWLSSTAAFLLGRVNGLSPWVAHSTLVAKEVWSQVIFAIEAPAHCGPSFARTIGFLSEVCGCWLTRTQNS